MWLLFKPYQIWLKDKKKGWVLLLTFAFLDVFGIGLLVLGIGLLAFRTFIFKQKKPQKNIGFDIHSISLSLWSPLSWSSLSFSLSLPPGSWPYSVHGAFLGLLGERMSHVHLQAWFCNPFFSLPPDPSPSVAIHSPLSIMALPSFVTTWLCSCLDLLIFLF